MEEGSLSKVILFRLLELEGFPKGWCIHYGIIEW